jgi:hypothetical protein
VTINYIVQTVGVLRDDGSTQTHITTANYTEWQEYLAWLKAGNLPTVVPTPDRYPTLADKRKEMKARLRGTYMRKTLDRLFVADGKTWQLREDTRLAILSYLTDHATPPGPTSKMTVLDADMQQHLLDKTQVKKLVSALVTRVAELAQNHKTLADQIDTSPDPMSVDIESGWGA